MFTSLNTKLNFLPIDDRSTRMRIFLVTAPKKRTLWSEETMLNLINYWQSWRARAFDVCSTIHVNLSILIKDDADASTHSSLPPSAFAALQLATMMKQTFCLLFSSISAFSQVNSWRLFAVILFSCCLCLFVWLWRVSGLVNFTENNLKRKELTSLLFNFCDIKKYQKSTKREFFLTN